QCGAVSDSDSSCIGTARQTITRRTPLQNVLAVSGYAKRQSARSSLWPTPVDRFASPKALLRHAVTDRRYNAVHFLNQRGATIIIIECEWRWIKPQASKLGRVNALQLEPDNAFLDGSTAVDYIVAFS